MMHWWKGSRDDTSASNLSRGCQQLYSPCVTGDNSCGREIVAIFPSCWVGQGKSDKFTPQCSALSRVDALLHSMAFLILYHLLTSTPVWYYVFGLEILSFLFPFTPSVDTVLCVCLGKIQLAQAGGECIHISWNCWFREGTWGGEWLKRPAPR